MPDKAMFDGLGLTIGLIKQLNRNSDQSFEIMVLEGEIDRAAIDAQIAPYGWQTTPEVSRYFDKQGQFASGFQIERKGK